MPGMKGHLSILVFLMACGGGSSGGGGDDGNSPDAPKVFMDAPPNVPAMIKLSGVAEQQAQSGSTPQAGVAIAILKRGTNESLATATSDAQGKYSMMVATNGAPVDAYLKATKTGYVDTYAYPGGAWIADSTSADANMLDSGTYSLLVGFGGGSTSKGVIAIGVFDGSMQPVQGAKVESAPASGVYKYSDDGGLPTGTDATNTDGHAFMFDVPDGEVTVKATKASASFKSHALSAKAGAFTTTVITM